MAASPLGGEVKPTLYVENGLPAVTSGTVDLDARGRRTALLFTGGVDSFHALLTRGARPDLLVFVHGYDVALDDRRRAESVTALVDEVAGETGTRALVLRTNLREHALLRATDWEQVHGGGLAAVGHLLSASIARLVVASSFSRRYHVPWGSHFRIDHLWSSRAVRIEHFGEHANRTQKIVAIAHEPLVQRHLRVCWENRTPTGNCGACPKCTVTMAALAQIGMLEAVQTLRPARPLAELLAQDGLERFRQPLRELVALDPGSAVGRAAAERLRVMARRPSANRVRRLVDDVAVRWHAHRR